MNSNKRIFSNTIYLYLRLVFTLIVSLYATKVALNVLGVVDYGINNVVAGFVSMFGFLNVSMVNTVQRFYNYEKGLNNGLGLRTVYNMALRIQLILAILIFVLLEIVGVWYLNNRMVIPSDRLYAANWVFQFSTMSLIFVILQIPYSAAIVSHEKMNFYAIVGMCDAVIKLVIVLALPYATCDSLILYGSSLFLVSILDFLAFSLYAKLHFKEIKFERGFNFSMFKKIASFSGWNIFDSFAYMIQGQGLNIMINSFFGPIINAARGIAYQIQGVIFNFSSNLSVAFKPQLVESYAKEDYCRVKSLFYTMSKSCFFMQYVLSIPIIFELDYILNLWLGNDIPDYTTRFVRFVLINSIIDSFNMPMSQLVQAIGKIKIYQFIRSLVVLSVIPLSYVALIYNCDPDMVFMSMLLITLVMQPLSLILLHNIYKFSYLEYCLKVFFPSLIFAVLVPIPSIFINETCNEGFFRLLLTIFSLLIMSLIIGWIAFLDKQERESLRSYIKNRLRKYSTFA